MAEGEQRPADAAAAHERGPRSGSIWRAFYAPAKVTMGSAMPRGAGGGLAQTITLSPLVFSLPHATAVIAVKR